MEISFGRALWRNFLGQSPDWYKLTLLVFLVVNPVIFLLNPFIAGWLLVAEFIFTLAMALKCYPLLPGGLLALEAMVIGMTSAEHVKNEIASNHEVLLLLIFMVAGIYFMKQLLLFIFTRLLLSIPSKTLLSLAFCLAAAFLSAFLDALTVVAVVISVAVGFYGIYHRVASSRPGDNLQDDSHVEAHNRDVLEQFRAFLRSLMMHAGVGTALGGVMTMVGEPQNLIIAKAAEWHFGEFFLRMAPVSLNDVLEQSIAGLYGALTARGIQPQIEMPNAPVVRALDKAALRRVFDNVIGNAARYSDGDLSVVLAPDGEIRIENSAANLTAVQAARLFDRFYTVNSARGGTGLGLSIAKGLTEKMGGEIGADVRAGRLCVRIRFP